MQRAQARGAYTLRGSAKRPRMARSKKPTPKAPLPDAPANAGPLDQIEPLHFREADPQKVLVLADSLEGLAIQARRWPDVRKNLRPDISTWHKVRIDLDNEGFKVGLLIDDVLSPLSSEVRAGLAPLERRFEALREALQHLSLCVGPLLTPWPERAKKPMLLDTYVRTEVACEFWARSDLAFKSLESAFWIVALDTSAWLRRIIGALRGSALEAEDGHPGDVATYSPMLEGVQAIARLLLGLPERGGLSAQELASKAGYSPSYVHNQAVRDLRKLGLLGHRQGIGYFIMPERRARLRAFLEGVSTTHD